MTITMEQYHGSIARYIIDNSVEGITAYFGKLPENFAVPSVFFPVPRTETRKAALNHWYRTVFHFECNFFACDDWNAYKAAVTVRDKMIEDDFWIPVYEEDGTETKYAFKCGNPTLENLEEGTENMSFDFENFVDVDPARGKIIETANITEERKPDPEG